MSGVVVDPERAEVHGPPQAVRELLDGSEEPGPPLLAAGLRAARSPLARFRVTGLPEPVEALAGADAAVVVLQLEAGHVALRACTPSGLLGLLVRVVGLCPRPRVEPREPILVGADRMAAIVNDRTASHAGLDEAQERLLQEHFDALVAHWRIEAHGGGEGWYLEVLDSERGLWPVEDAADGRLALTPTGATAVLDELAALPGHVGLGP